MSTSLGKSFGGNDHGKDTLPTQISSRENILDISSMKQKYPGAAIEERDNRAKKNGAKENLQMERSGMEKTEDWTLPRF